MSEPDTSTTMLRRSTRRVAATLPHVALDPPGASKALRRVRTVSKSTTVADEEQLDINPKRPAKKAKVEVDAAEEDSRESRRKLTSKVRVTDEVDGEEVIETKTKRRRKKKDVPELEPTLADFAPRPTNAWKLGAHVSAAGGVENTVVNAASIGANAFALFVKSQRKWTGPPLTEESVAKFKSRLETLQYSPKHILPHGSYLINLGNPDDEKREKAYQCFLDDLKRCEQLGLHLYNFHPGSTVGIVSAETSLTHIADCLNRAHNETSSIVTVIENMAGAGNVIGGAFSDIGGIIRQVDDKSRVGVCLDTCHMFAAGYDIRTREGWSAMMDEFDAEIGLQYLRGMHLNDSKGDLASKKDRHENIGLGFLGLKTFHHILVDERIQNIPLVMETPQYDDNEVWRKELEVLNRLSGLSISEEVKTKGADLVSWTDEIQAVVKAANAAGNKKGAKVVQKKTKSVT
ncbi:AP endonuclease [Neolentinus lepideus HHB14362 ss-1]|uniref:Apurinic-apyrimidinic endonuclease 1 n=1 Tax=Neolentinus lepideus HHB14362 ss-1 TaxID=1314782 RepID=A0A165RIW6_9AGAM|nr:AP endonuclease [Neolentinus lepideus HHB14362 ss-1]